MKKLIASLVFGLFIFSCSLLFATPERGPEIPPMPTFDSESVFIVKDILIDCFLGVNAFARDIMVKEIVSGLDVNWRIFYVNDHRVIYTRQIIDQKAKKFVDAGIWIDINHDQIVDGYFANQLEAKKAYGSVCKFIGLVVEGQA